MKLYKKLALGLLPLAALGWVACSEEVYKGTELVLSVNKDYLVVDNLQLHFNADGGQQQVKIESSNDWTLTDLPEWVSVDKNSGTGEATLTITAQTNPTPAERIGIFKAVKGQGDNVMTRTFQIGQTAAKPHLEMDESTLSFLGKGGSFNIPVNTNIEDIKTSASEGWLHPSYSNGILTVTADPCAVDGRQATVSISSAQFGLSKTINATQVKAEIGQVNKDISGRGGYTEWTFDAVMDWTITSDSEWLKAIPSSGKAGKQTVKIQAEPLFDVNGRDGIVTLHYLNASNRNGSHAIHQNGRDITLDATALDYTAAGGSLSVGVTADVDWKVISKPDWISLNRTSASESDNKVQLVVTAAENNIVAPRSGQIVIRESSVGMIERSISVSQKIRDFKHNNLEFSWHTSSQAIHLPFGGNWTGTSSKEWLTLSQYSGVDEADVNVNVTRNDDWLGRSGELAFSLHGNSYPIIVEQQGQLLNMVSGENQTFDANGGKCEIRFDGNVDLKAQVDYEGVAKDWISLEYKESQIFSHHFYYLTIAKSSSAYARKAYFRLLPPTEDINPVWAQGFSFEMNQAGRRLTANLNKWGMGYDGVTPVKLVITADGDYEIVKKNSADTWFNIVKDPELPNTYTLEGERNINATEERHSFITVRMKDQPADEAPYSFDIEVVQMLPPVQGADGRIKYTVNGVDFYMIPVLGGTYIMGNNNARSDVYAKPAHEVTVGDFRIAETEVTQELYQAVMGTNPSSQLKSIQCPVNYVNWPDVVAFCDSLSNLTGFRFRLPSEIEWEYAARGGSLTHNYTYSGSNDYSDVAHYSNLLSEACPVKSYQANELGLYDMSGNVAEWCDANFTDYPLHEAGSGEKYRVTRGGNAYYWPQYLTVWARYRNNPTGGGSRNAWTGFRIAMSGLSDN